MTRTSGAIGGSPLRRNPQMIAALGDSRAKAIYQDSANGKSLSALSALNWANALLGQRLVIGQTFGNSGDTTEQMLARIDAAVASGAGVLYILGGVNDISAGIAGATSAANIITMAERGRGAGMIVVIEAEIGSGSLTTTAALTRLNDLNRMLRDYADVTPGVYLHDALPAVLDPAVGPSAVAYRTGYNYDATHPNGRGAYYWGKSLATLLAALVPPRASPLLACRADSDVANGRRQLCANPLFVTATGGTLSNATGSVPSGWTGGATAAGPTCAISTEANTLGNSTVFDVTFTAISQTARLSQTVDVNNWQAGDVVQLVADVEIVTPGPLAALYGQIDCNVASVSVPSYSLFSPETGGTNPYLGAGEACRLTLMTRPYTIPAGTEGWLIASIRGVAQAAGAAKWKVHQCAVIRRADAGY